MAGPQLVDIEEPGALIAYLRRAARIPHDEAPRVRVLGGGVSNKTVLVERPSGEAWVLKQALPKLRTQADWFSDPARIRREAEGLRWLLTVAPPGAITPLVFEDAAQHILAMQAVPQPHENWKSMWLANCGEARLYVRQFGHLLGQIHRAGFERRAETARLFGDRSFFESLRLEPYYAYSAAQVPEAAGFLQELIDATRRRCLTVVHGDYSPKNVLIHNGQLVLLDHEVIHFGDPAFDIGFAFAHLLSKANHLPRSDRFHFRDAVVIFWINYAKSLGSVPWGGGLVPRGGDPLQRWIARHTLACLLARVVGRSPLEYLNDRQRARQRDAVLEIIAMREPQPTGLWVAGRFLERV